MKKLLMVGLVLMVGSSAFAITASEIGKQYFPQYQSAKGLNCEALKTRFKEDKTSSFASYTTDAPFYLVTQPFEVIVETRKFLGDIQTSKRYGLFISNITFSKFDSDFAEAGFAADLSMNKQSISFHFDRLEKYKTGICIRVFAFKP